jgi:transposase
VKRRRMRPESIPAFTKSMPSFIVAMEACGGAHHLSRLLTARGHTVRLISPEDVPSIRKGTKRTMTVMRRRFRRQPRIPPCVLWN